MKESYMEELANHHGLEPYAFDGNIEGVASARGSVGQLLSSESTSPACRPTGLQGKATSGSPSIREEARDGKSQAVRQLCERCVWLEKGRLREDGPAGEVIDRYTRFNES